MFNGQVLSADRISPGRIEGHWTEYRRIVAQMREPALHDMLLVRPVSVNGLLECASGILLGRREANAAYQPGLWQTPPAGSIDPRAACVGGEVSPIAQLMTELREELGLAPHQVCSIRPICLVEHPGSHVLDLGIAMRTTIDMEAITAAHATAADREYDRLAAIPVAAIPHWMARQAWPVAQQSLAFLKCWFSMRSGRQHT